MSKDSSYFSHDYNTRSDSKIKKLIRIHGMIGYGIWWAIVEDLYNNSNILERDYESIAYDLRVKVEIIKKIVEDFDLFILNEKYFSSASIDRRLNFRNKKSASASESASKRWDKNANALNDDANALNNDANAMRTECEGNAHAREKERKKESKVNKINSNANASPEWAIDFKNYNPELIYPFEFKAFAEKWDLWSKFRVKKRWGKYEEIGEQSALKKISLLSAGSLDDCLEIIDQSIAGGWRSFNELKKSKNQQAATNGNPSSENIQSDIALYAASRAK
ncbi:MAG: Lin1244/Lin1753 domain-containing protein [Bacteroidota bacterium]